MGKIKSLSVTDCDVTGPALDLTNNFHNINENGDKAIDFDLDLPDDLDATDITVRVHATFSICSYTLFSSI